MQVFVRTQRSEVGRVGEGAALAKNQQHLPFSFDDKIHPEIENSCEGEGAGEED